ncbi:MAG: DUF1559 domain-containing protein [Planctomycetaceae bacterium]|jgi:hypothetical protein|nr:DUF1559 domain-containing protein [Planctomycetaceae bacterium]
MLRKLSQVGILPALLVSAMLFIVTNNLTTAQETFAPLITDNCIGFIHVDLRKLELANLKSLCAKTAETHLKDMKFDVRSYERTMREVYKELDIYEQIIRPQFDQITKKLGIRELAVIIDMDMFKLGFQALVAVSWKNKTKDDLELLSSLFDKFDIQVEFFQSGDFLFFTNSQFLQQTTVWTKNITPSKNATIYEALKDAGDNEIKAALTISENLRKEIIAKKTDDSLPEQVNNIIKFSANKINWITVSISLGRLISESKKESLKLVIKTPKENDAVFLRNLFETSIDNGIFLAKMVVEAQMTNRENNDLKLPLSQFEYFAGITRLLLPEVKGDRLVTFLEVDPNATINSSNFTVAYCGMMTGLLLPAVQSARAAAQRMQCINNIRQIVLAFHTYHDAYNELPPLYTVDAAGKPLHSWRVLILPYIEQNKLYSQIRLNEPWDSEYNKQFHSAVIPSYTCPLVKKDIDPNKKCNYSVIAGQPLSPKKGIGFDKISDGTSNTVAVVVVKKPFCWMDPKADISLDDFVKGINKKDSVIGFDKLSGVNVGFWDASTRSLAPETPTEILKAIGTANGGEVVDHNSP